MPSSSTPSMHTAGDLTWWMGNSTIPSSERITPIHTMPLPQSLPSLQTLAMSRTQPEETEEEAVVCGTPLPHPVMAHEESAITWNEVPQLTSTPLRVAPPRDYNNVVPLQVQDLREDSQIENSRIMPTQQMRWDISAGDLSRLYATTSSANVTPPMMTLRSGRRLA